MRLKLGSATGLSMTMVPSDVREHAPSGSIKLPATTIMPILRVPTIGLEESRFANVPWARTSWRFWGGNGESRDQCTGSPHCGAGIAQDREDRRRMAASRSLSFAEQIRSSAILAPELLRAKLANRKGNPNETADHCGIGRSSVHGNGCGAGNTRQHRRSGTPTRPPILPARTSANSTPTTRVRTFVRLPNSRKCGAS